MIDLSGKSIGRYHLIEQIGEGGMAVVYKAFDTRLECEVAVKFIRTEQLAPVVLDKALKRFEREAKAVAQLNHPNIIKVMDYGDYEGIPYLVMSYLSGGSLKHFLSSPLPWPEAVKLIKPVASALAYAHAQGVIHRDVKPGNILITASGEPMLTDFGIAKILEGQEGQTLTGTGVGIGTPEYMAPEQGMGKEIDARADIYSLGVVLYELITGRKPYTADTPMAVVFKHVNDPLPRPGVFVAGLPEEVERIIFKSMAKAPADRYASMTEMLAALNRLDRLTSEPALPPVRARDSRAATPVEPDSLATMDALAETDNNQRQSVSTLLESANKLNKVTPSREKSEKTPAPKKPHTMKKGWIWLICLLVLAGAITTISFLLKTGKPETPVANSLAGESTSAINTPTEEPTSIVETPAMILSNLPITPENANQVSQVGQMGKGSIKQVVYSPSGQLLAVASSIGIYLYDSRDLSQIRFIDTGFWINSVAFSPDGQTLASGSTDNTIQLWNVSDGSLLSTLSGHSYSVLSLAFSPDGQTLASGSSDNTIKLWHVSDGSLMNTLSGHSDSVKSIAFSPDGQTLASGSADNTIKLWSVSDGSLQQTLYGRTDSVDSIAFSPNDQLLASSSGDGTIIWRISDGSLLHTLSGHTDWVNSVAFSPDGQTLASGSYDKTIKLWRISDGSLLQTLDGHSNSVMSVAFSQDGQTLASGSFDNTIKLWRVSDGSLLQTLGGHTDWVNSVAFSPDGQMLASGSGDGTIKLWHVSDGSLLQTLNGHTGLVNSVAFSPDGQTLASGSSDGTISLWRVSNGSLLQTLSGHTSPVYSVVFSPDGQTLASGSDDGTIRLWGILNN